MAPFAGADGAGFTVSALECLFQHMQLLVQLAVLAAVAADLAHRVQHGGVIAPAKQLADLGQALLRQLLDRKSVV